jgi:hypothetical protein
MTDYKQLAEELYEALKQVINVMNASNRYGVSMCLANKVLEKYEEETTRSTGRTTALYMKAITEALENPAKSVEFIDHYPHNWMIARQHALNMENIIKKLGYEIVVSTKGQAQVFLCNKFGL